MKEVIWLVVSARAVERMTKRMPATQRDEIAVKVYVEVPLGAFRPPVLERSLLVEDWRDGTELADLDLRQDVITQAEAEILRERGFEVTPPAEETEEGEDDAPGTP